MIVVVFIEEPLPEKKKTKRDEELEKAEGTLLSRSTGRALVNPYEIEHRCQDKES